MRRLIPPVTLPPQQGRIIDKLPQDDDLRIPYNHGIYTGQFMLGDFQKLNSLIETRVETANQVDKYLHSPTNEFVAIKKVITITGGTDLKAVKREVDILTQLKTHNQNFLIKFYGCGVENKECLGETAYYLCTEVADGSLFSLPKAIEVDFADSNLLQYINFAVVTALDFLYTKKIIHRDVKPANILYKFIRGNRQSERIIIKLTDFGISRELVNNGASTVGNATFNYMAPERESNFANDGAKTRYGVETDIWSLAITILEMHMGEYPLTALLSQYNNNVSQLLAHFRAKPFNIIDGIGVTFTDEALKEYLQNALLPSAGNNPQNGQLFRPRDYDQLKSFDYVQTFPERSRNEYDPITGTFELPINNIEDD